MTTLFDRLRAYDFTVKAALPDQCFLVEKSNGQTFFVDLNADRAKRVAPDAVPADIRKAAARDVSEWLPAIAVVLDQTTPEPAVSMKELRVDLAKALDDDKMLATGWGSVITNPDGTPYVDFQADVIEEQELMKAVHDFMTHSRTAGEVHYRTKGVGRVVDSLVVTADIKKALGLPPTTPSGWFVTIKVEDPAVWAKIKSGEYSAFSIGGSAIREPME